MESTNNVTVHHEKCAALTYVWSFHQLCWRGHKVQGEELELYDQGQGRQFGLKAMAEAYRYW